MPDQQCHHRLSRTTRSSTVISNQWKYLLHNLESYAGGSWQPSHRLILLCPKTLLSHPCEECEGVTEDFRSVKWWCADDEIIDVNVDALSLFTPEAYHYYLPAFLLRALAEFEPDNQVLQFCIYSLNPGEDGPWRRARMNEFTPEQIAVVAGFLEIVLQDERFSAYYADAELGLRKLWHSPDDFIGPQPG